jgi:hypothetical protein
MRDFKNYSAFTGSVVTSTLGISEIDKIASPALIASIILSPSITLPKQV